MDAFIDVVLANRTYMPCLYVYNKIDQISLEEVDRIARQKHCVSVTVCATHRHTLLVCRWLLLHSSSSISIVYSRRFGRNWRSCGCIRRSPGDRPTSVLKMALFCGEVLLFAIAVAKFTEHCRGSLGKRLMFSSNARYFSISLADTLLCGAQVPNIARNESAPVMCSNTRT